MPRENDNIPMTELIAQNAAAGNIRTVDVAAEREKKKYMGVEEFADKFSKYTLPDYLHTDAPYYDLLEYSRAQPGLFEQFAAVLTDSAKAQMHARNNDPYEKYVSDQISVIREAFLPDLTEAVSILDYINKVETDPETADMVSVLPLMCGSGKSTAITKKIIEVIQREDKLGMLLVTDSTKRLDEIWNSKTTNPLLSDEEKEFIRTHKKDVSILTAETYAEEINRQAYVPVLCMTTQRFFYVLTKQEIKDFLEWKDDHGTLRRRSLILFDEEPFLNEVYDLTPKTVNDIDTMLRMVLDDTPTKQQDKAWCIRQWETFRIQFLDQLWLNEHDYEGNMFYHEQERHGLTDDDDRFFAVIMENRGRIRADSTEVFKSLFAMKAFADTWSVYSYRPGKEYESKFTVYVDNSDKVKDLGAKVIVLDGTGDISPTYSGLDYIDPRNGESFVRSLSHLTVRLGDVVTSKQQLGEGRSFIPRAIISYLNSVGYDRENTVIFTYKQHETKFNKAFKKRTEHFGNIKGMNDYQDETCIAQVGLNQMQPVHYLVHMLARHEDIRSTLIGLSPDESSRLIKDILKETNNCEEIMISHLLADVDQNMFRSAIRRAKNRQDVVYYVFYKDQQVRGLREAIRSRYCDTLGASLELVDEDTVLAAEREMDTSAAGRILRWYQEWDGEVKTREEICKELNMSPNTFKETIRRNDRLKEIFEKAKVKARQNGHKRGCYMKQ